MTAILRCITIVLPFCLCLTGCANNCPLSASSSLTFGASPSVQGELGTLTYRAVDIILSNAPELGAATPLVVASISDLKNIETTSALGNIVADMIRTRLVQMGHPVTDMRLRKAVSLNQGAGEFLLSRNRRALMPAPSAAAIVTGTYAESFSKVYVSLKLISATDARIIAGADFVVPLLDVVGLLPDARRP